MAETGTGGGAAVITHRVRDSQHDEYERWLASPTRLALIEKAMPILSQGDSYTIHSGVDFLFTAHDGSQRVPVRWKQFLVTWSAIYPLTFVLPMIIGPPLDWLGWRNHLVSVTIVSASAVLLMVYVIMPRYTRLVRRWLFR